MEPSDKLIVRRWEAAKAEAQTRGLTLTVEGAGFVLRENEAWRFTAETVEAVGAYLRGLAEVKAK